jgi:hypothetical protein
MPTFQNLAGVSLCARPEALTPSDEMVTFRCADGSRIDVPLKVFPQEEQARIRTMLGIPTIPKDLRVPFERHCARLKKARALHQKGLMSDDALKATEARLARAWALRLSKRPPEAPPMPEMPEWSAPMEGKRTVAP